MVTWKWCERGKYNPSMNATDHRNSHFRLLPPSEADSLYSPRLHFKSWQNGHFIHLLQFSKTPVETPICCNLNPWDRKHHGTSNLTKINIRPIYLHLSRHQLSPHFAVILTSVDAVLQTRKSEYSGPFYWQVLCSRSNLDILYSYNHCRSCYFLHSPTFSNLESEYLHSTFATEYSCFFVLLLCYRTPAYP